MRGLKDKVTIVAGAPPGNIGENLTDQYRTEVLVQQRAVHAVGGEHAVCAVRAAPARSRGAAAKRRVGPGPLPRLGSPWSPCTAAGGVMQRHPVSANGARGQTMLGRTGAGEEQMA